ncbi:heme lyase CcmF/NrfE family subunit [Dehalococcoidia bacterium]|nr:heme lyase CcmF/NrfE family subunit [Dehalococcoidia bacterium]
MAASDIGFVSLILSLAIATYTIGAAVLGHRAGLLELTASSKRGVWAVTALMLIAAAILSYSLYTHDFGVEFVARNSSRAQPWYYTMSAFYGGQAGSLLVWSTGLAVFSGLAVWINRRRNAAIMPYVIATLMTIQLFFLILLVFISNPFERLATPLADGQGLNPLLRDPGMLIHPPFLLFGYMSWSVPFAFAIGALISGRIDSEWLKAARPWVLAAWAIQGTGLLLGAWWAYHVLGWGGYWGWDPVENVALLPWLVGTAFLHSVVVQERRGMLKKWNMLLIITTFCLSIFGTLVVRGGLLSSVHNFATSSLGPAFLAFLGFTLIVSLYLFLKRSPFLRSDQKFDSIVSRESAFLLNNLLLIGVAFATLWGSIFPLLTEAFDGSRVTVGAPFYEKVNGPILLALLVLMGIGPLLAWRQATWQMVKRNFRWPIIVALAWTAIMVGALGITNWWTLAGVSASTFAFWTVALEYYRGTRLRRRNSQESYPVAITSLIANNRRRYGGYIVHIAILLIAIGVIGSNLHQQEHEVTLAAGEDSTVGDYNFTFRGINKELKADEILTSAEVEVTHDGDFISIMRPHTSIFTNFENQPSTHIAIRSSITEDLYIFLSAFDQSTATFVIFINPLVIWIWIGGGVFLLGTVITMWPERSPAPIRTQSNSNPSTVGRAP